MKKSIKRQFTEGLILSGCAVAVTTMTNIKDKEGNKLITGKTEDLIKGTAVVLGIAAYTKLSVARFRIIKRILF